jgi:hypothetical protein
LDRAAKEVVDIEMNLYEAPTKQKQPTLMDVVKLQQRFGL